MEKERMEELRKLILELNETLDSIQIQELKLENFRNRIYGYWNLEHNKQDGRQNSLACLLFEVLFLVMVLTGILGSVSPFFVSALLVVLSGFVGLFAVDSIMASNKLKREYPDFLNLSSEEIFDKHSECLNKESRLSNEKKLKFYEKNMYVAEYAKLIEETCKKEEELGCEAFLQDYDNISFDSMESVANFSKEEKDSVKKMVKKL